MCVREGGGPLRGEKPKKVRASISEKSCRGSATDAPVRVVDGAGQAAVRCPCRRRIRGSSWALVDLVWALLDRPAARKLVEAAARSELVRVAGFAGRTDAPQVLTDRIARRLEDQMRLGGPIKDPVGWLISLALPQRQQCGDVRCDDRVLPDSGRQCPRWEERQAGTRAQRRTVAAAIDAAMPGACEAERRTATERQLHQDVTARGWAKARGWERVRERQAAAKARVEAKAVPANTGVPAVSVADVVVPVPRSVAVIPVPEAGLADVDGDQVLVLEELTREQVLDWRTRAAHDHQIMFGHIDRYGEESAKRLFTRALIAQVQRVASLGHLDLGYTPWGQS
jgi:hypothetical protein